ncbi:MAG: PKD domain-containing protein, partial [Rhodothermales bacterium]|nr:PKD domain-containing protein [Rhodothermales bacterium]
MRYLLPLALLLLVEPAMAQSLPATAARIAPPERDATTYTATARVNDRTGFPVTVYHTPYRARPAAPAEMAWSYVKDSAATLGIDDLAQLAHVNTRETLSGYRVQFDQLVSGVPVYEARIVVSLGEDGRIHFVSNGFQPGIRDLSVASKTGSAGARSIARAWVEHEGPPVAETQETVIFSRAGRSRLAHRVQMVTGQGSWEFLVDASSGELILAEPRGHAGAPRSGAGPTGSFGRAASAAQLGVETSRQADGTAMVFDPDPMTTLRAAYGETSEVSDNNDADSDALTSARTSVTLRDITETSGVFELTGPNVVITDFDPPFLGTFAQSSPDFDFTRSQPAFEAATVYHHIDQSMRYLNDELGFNVQPLQYAGGVQVDPHGLEGAVNAQYLFTGQLRFGEGGADMAEDPEVVLHELGHAIHDWITNRGLSREAGLGEGSADYWAASYTRSKSSWTESDPERENFGRWGGRPFFQGRSTDYAGRFPFSLTGSIHTDGQIWSTAMIRILDQIGREKSDVLFLEGLSMTAPGNDTEDAARAVLKADSLLFGGENAGLMLETFVRSGFIFRAAAAAAGRAGPGPLSVSFFDLSTFGEGSATSWAWDFETDGQVDATSSLASHTYDQPGLYSVTLTASNGERTESTTLTDYVSVNSGIYVWEGIGNPTSRSGRFIFDELQEAGVEAHYSRTADIHPSLEGFDAVFLSFGPFDPQNQPTPLKDTSARVIRDYLAAGGRVYLEGGDVIGFDQTANNALLDLFGVNIVTDGSSESRPVTSLVGQTGSLADGLLYTSSRQTATTSVDRIESAGSGQVTFVQENYGAVGIQNQNSGGGRSVVMTYTLADLDANGSSTRNALLSRILDYFGLAVQLDAEPAALPTGLSLGTPYPNPTTSEATLDLVMPGGAFVDIDVYDILGRRVMQPVSG